MKNKAIKKKIISIVFCLCLVASLIPTVAFAGSNEIITISYGDSNEFSIPFEPTDKIEDVKSYIYNELGCAPSRQKLFIAGKQLDDDDRLQDCSVQKGNTLDLEINYDATVNEINYKILTFSKDGNFGTAEVGDNTANTNNSVAIPESISIDGGQYSVVSVGKYAFENCNNLQSVSLPNSIKEIKRMAFLGSGMETISIPDSVKTIGECAFAESNSLKTIIIPDSVTKLDGGVFMWDEELTSVKLPKNIALIEDEMFTGCEKLNNLLIPEAVKTIGVASLSGCTGLTNITINCNKSALFNEENHTGITLSSNDNTKYTVDDSSVEGTITFSHSLITHNAVAPTYEKEGSIEFYECKDCGKLFEDKNATKEIEISNTVVAKLVKPENISDEKENVENNKKADTIDAVNKKDNALTSPKTGYEISPCILFSLMGLSGIGIIYIVCVKKKKLLK